MICKSCRGRKNNINYLLHFKSADESWLDFVMANRRNTYNGKKYDVIYGPVANETVYRTLIAFENGVLSAEDTIARLKVRKLFDQITFVSEYALSFLKYLNFIEVPND